jgi:hypothetical protein
MNKHDWQDLLLVALGAALVVLAIALGDYVIGRMP